MSDVCFRFLCCFLYALREIGGVRFDGREGKAWKERVRVIIELIYDQQRLDSGFCYVSPVEFEQEVKSALWHVSILAPTCPV